MTTARGAYRYYVLFMLIVVYTVNFIDRQIVGILAPAIKAELSLSDTQLGLLSTIDRHYVEGLCRKVGALKENDIGKMLLINHEVSDFENILVDPFDGISCHHEVLILILALLYASSNFLNVVTLVFGLTD